MGSSHPAHTYVETEISSFCPGAILPGVIKILVDKATHAEQISIHLTCIGESHWDSGSGKHRRHYSAKRTLIKLQFPIWNFGGSLPEGQFALPFSIQLPNDLIPSFKYHNYSTKGSIEYYLEAIVGDNRDIMAHKSVIWINRYPNPSHIISPVSSEATLKVSNCCCFKTGTASLKSTLNLNVATIMEDLITTSHIENTNNKYNITKATCSLIRKIRLKGRHLFIPSSKVFSQEVLQKSQFLAIKPGQSDSPDISLGLSLNECQDLWMQPPLASEVVDCEYVVRVKLEFDNFCGCGGYYVSLPVEICNGTMVLNNKLSEPPKINVEWNPMMISEVRVHTTDFSNMQIGDEDNHNKHNQQAHVTQAKTKADTDHGTKGDEMKDETIIDNKI